MCVTLTRFQTTYQDDGQPKDFRAEVSYTLGDGPATSTVIKVNDPLRLAGIRVYLLGHGYAPVLRYTDRYGRAQTAVAPFPRVEGPNLTSGGVVAFPDANVNPVNGRGPGDKQQVAFEGVYVPTTASDGRGLSVFPAERNPLLVITPYRGDMGVDAGIPGSVYTLDQRQIRTGRLKAVTGTPSVSDRAGRPGWTTARPCSSSVPGRGSPPRSAMTRPSRWSSSVRSAC